MTSSDLVKDVGMGALYLASKLEECPVRMRDLINVYDLLLQRSCHSLATKSQSNEASEFKYTPMSYFAQAFYDLKDSLVVSEMQILKRLGFNVQVVLPYGTLVNYLRVLGLLERENFSQQAWGYLNDACVTYFQKYVAIPLSADCLIVYRHLCMHYIQFQLWLALLLCLRLAICVYRCLLNLLLVGGNYSTRSGKTYGVLPVTLCVFTVGEA